MCRHGNTDSGNSLSTTQWHWENLIVCIFRARLYRTWSSVCLGMCMNVYLCVHACGSKLYILLKKMLSWGNLWENRGRIKLDSNLMTICHSHSVYQMDISGAWIFCVDINIYDLCANLTSYRWQVYTRIHSSAHAGKNICKCCGCSNTQNLCRGVQSCTHTHIHTVCLYVFTLLN